VTEEARRFSAVYDFRQARQQAALRQILARLQGKPIELLSYETVLQRLGNTGSSERGLQEIPLDAIAGSVGRTGDYTRGFFPRHDSDEDRWASVKAAATDPMRAGLPPIQVYQVGQAYFVLDGHHRVSVARQMGLSHIQAYVTEVRTKAPLSADASPEELIAKSEYVSFLEATRLDETRPSADLAVTIPGQIEHLLRQISLRRSELPQQAGAAVDVATAAADWYDHVYLPVVQLLRERGLLRDFPGRTEADLYLLVSAHRASLEEALGWQVAPEVSAQDLAAKRNSERGMPVVRAGRRLLKAVVPSDLRPGPAVGQWRREKVASRYSDRLFADILVPVSGEPSSWLALDQALAFAEREGARLYGLHVVPGQDQLGSPAARAVREQFVERCCAARVPGDLAIESGNVAAKICDRAALTDVVVLNLAYPPAPQLLSRLGSGFRTIIRHCPRPVLAVPDAAEPFERVLIAYDGSQKAEEALFVATYFAETWRLPLVLVTVKQGEAVTAANVDHARAYVEMHELEATYVVHDDVDVASAVAKTSAAHDCNLIVMGGYGANAVVKVMLGSAVDQVLRQARLPVLVCQ
jgi:nucleotide-binding universal stress UspA family protein